MTSGRYWNPCYRFPPNEARSTEMTFATSSTRCSTSHTPGASGASCPGSSVRGPGSGPSFAGGRGTERGRGYSPHCTRRRARLSVARTRDPQWSSSIPTSPAGPRTGVSPSTTKVVLMAAPTGPSALSAWTSPVCRSVCESSPPRRPRRMPSNRYSTTSPEPERTSDWSSCSWTGAPRSRQLIGCRQVQLRGSPGWMGRAATQRARCQGLSPHPPRLAS